MRDLKESRFTKELDASNFNQVVVDKDYISAGNFFGKFFESDDQVKKDQGIKELVRKYRRYAQFPKVSKAVTIISNGMVISEDGESVVDINVDKLNTLNSTAEKRIKNAIPELFSEVKRMLLFDMYGVDHVKQWYIDGGLFVYFEGQDKKGITEIRVLDRCKLTLVKEGTKLIYEYDFPKGKRQINFKNVIFIPSGLVDPTTNMNIGYLNKAIRPVNLLNMLENSLVVYRFVRAPERYIFQIDVAGKNKKKGQQYIKNMMSKYRSKFNIDTLTGELNSSNMTMAMQENFWFAKTNSQNGGHSIDSIGGSGASGLDNLDDVKYFREEVYNALHVPVSRLQPEASFAFGARTEEISRDENDFQEFKNYLRKRFSLLFTELIGIHGNLKGSFQKTEYNEVKNDIRYKFKNDSIYYEAKKRAKLEARMEMLQQYGDQILKWYGEPYLRKEVLGQNDEEIKQYKKDAKEWEKQNPSNEEM